MAGNGNIGWFFRQWVLGTEVPRYEFEYSVKPDGEGYRMDLAEDLETLGPDGQRLPALSRMGLETLREKTAQATGASAEFTNTLNFTKPGPGSYVARLTIRDNVGQNLKTHDVRFDLP